MDKNNRLINIYIKIHNKKTITMEDLQYLAQYDPECFRKTCRNVVYNIPESKVVMEPVQIDLPQDAATAEPISAEFDALAILERLKQLDANSSLHAEVDAVRVKNLLGNLFMELLFPHNDKETFIYEDVSEDESTFDMKA